MSRKENAQSEEAPSGAPKQESFKLIVLKPIRHYGEEHDWSGLRVMDTETTIIIDVEGKRYVISRKNRLRATLGAVIAAVVLGTMANYGAYLLTELVTQYLPILFDKISALWKYAH
jgi:hypothetical protein